MADSDLLRPLQWQYFANITVGVVGALYMLLLGRMLGVHAFGVYAIVAATPTMVSNCFDLRLQETVIYLQSRIGTGASDVDNDTVASIVTIDLFARMVGLLLSVAAGVLVAAYLGVGADFAVVLAAALTVFLGKAGNSPAMGILRMRGELDYFAKCQVSDWIMRTLLLVVLQRAGALSLLTIFVSQAGSAAFHNGLVIRRASRRFGADAGRTLFGGPHSVRRTCRAHRSLLLNGQAISISDSVIKELDTIAVASVLSVSAVGIYKMAKNFAGIAWRAADPIYIVILPRLAQLRSQADSAALRAFLRSMTLLLLGFGAILFAGSVLAAHVGVRLVLGPEFALTAAVFPLAGAWILVGTPLIWTHSLAFAAGRPGIQTRASAIGNVAGLLAIYAGAAWLGLPGAALGLSTAYALPFVLAFMFLRREGLTR
ncbi:MAG: lipopolysaccharide biosynthesis protein [Proteobacteria bacterium]|nr:lipopolysaccharide biosynthesis protein [Pseudomonadota bacterium]